MERRDRAGGWSDAGGIAGLCQLIEEHGAALDYDLLTKTSYNLRDIGGALPWGALLHFVQFLPRDSALKSDMEPTTDAERWTRGDATATILADLYDLVSTLRNEMAAKGSGKKPKGIKPYPRPGKKKNTEHFGKDPIPVAQFEDWWESRGRR